MRRDVKADANVALSEENDRLIAAIEHARKHVNSNPIEAELILLRAIRPKCTTCNGRGVVVEDSEWEPVAVKCPTCSVPSQTRSTEAS